MHCADAVHGEISHEWNSATDGGFGEDVFATAPDGTEVYRETLNGIYIPRDDKSEAILDAVNRAQEALDEYAAEVDAVESV